MSQNGFEVIAISADGPEVKEVIANEGCEHHVIPFSRSISPFRDFKCLVRLITLLRRLRPDIVHTHTPKAGLIGMLAAWICRVPVRLHTVAGLPLMEKSGLLKMLLIAMEKLTYLCATRVYPNSHNMDLYIREHILHNGDKLKIIGNGSSNGIDVNHFMRSDLVAEDTRAIRIQYGIRDAEKVLLTVCRISKEKGIEELVEAFSLVTRDYPDWKLMIVGPNDNDAIGLSRKTIETIEGNPKIICTGFQQDVRPFFAAADIFVFPSYREGFPNVVLQAACMELPIIASDINGCNEIVEEGWNGFLVPTKDSAALVDKMRDLIVDEARRKFFGHRSRERVVKRFNRQAVWAAILLEYRSFLHV